MAGGKRTADGSEPILTFFPKTLARKKKDQGGEKRKELRCLTGIFLCTTQQESNTTIFLSDK